MYVDTTKYFQTGVVTVKIKINLTHKVYGSFVSVKTIGKCFKDVLTFEQ